MRAKRQVDRRFGLAGPEMQMIEVVRDRLIEWRERLVDDHVMVARIRLLDSCRRDAHIHQAEPQQHFGRNVRVIGRIGDIQPCAGWRRMPRHASGGWGRGLRLDDAHLDPVRHDRGRVWDMIPITQYELKGVLARRELKLGFTLSGAVMEMIEVVGDRLIQRRQQNIDQDMMMT